MSNAKNAIFYLLTFFVLSSIVYFLSENIRKISWKDKGVLETVIMPDAKITKRISLGFTNLAADLLWIRTIRYMFIHNKSDKNYPEIPRFFTIINELDPNFEDMYRIGGEASRELTKDYNFSIELLEKGRKKFPENWKISYELGRAYAEKKDWVNATQSFEKTMKLPDAPEWISVHVAEGYYQQGEYQKSLSWWYEISKTASSEEVISESRSKVLFLVVVNGAHNIADAALHYYHKYNHLPDTPEVLFNEGFLEKMPEEPFGSRYLIDKNNFTITSEYIQKLLSDCLDKLNNRVEKYYHNFGSYPQSIDDLYNQPELGPNDFPGNPYGETYIIDAETHKVKSTKDYLAKIKVE
jgi:tetratricopeptide (TPR) repeat protein